MGGAHAGSGSVGVEADLGRAGRDQRPSLAEVAYREIHRRIISARIPPGAMLDLGHLADELQVGATPVREAVLRLARERLVTILRGRGTFASEIRLDDVLNVAEVRLTLEGHAARRAGQRATGAASEEIWSLQRALASQDPDDVLGAIELDARIHRFVYRAAGNPRLERTLGPYLDHCVRAWTAIADGLTDATFLQGHADVLAGIAARDDRQAQTSLLEHITRGISQLCAVTVARSPRPLTLSFQASLWRARDGLPVQGRSWDLRSAELSAAPRPGGAESGSSGSMQYGFRRIHAH
jgi:DNA-binding GntR family transcriptional regulator